MHIFTDPIYVHQSETAALMWTVLGVKRYPLLYPALDGTSETIEEHFLATSYDKFANIFGRFSQESIALGLSELRWWH